MGKVHHISSLPVAYKAPLQVKVGEHLEFEGEQHPSVGYDWSIGFTGKALEKVVDVSKLKDGGDPNDAPAGGDKGFRRVVFLAKTTGKASLSFKKYYRMALEYEIEVPIEVSE